MQIVYYGDNLHENVKTYFPGKNKNIVNSSSAELAQRVLKGLSGWFLKLCLLTLALSRASFYGLIYGYR